MNLKSLVVTLALLAVPFASVAEAGVSAAKPSFLSQGNAKSGLGEYKSKKGAKKRGAGRSVAEAFAVPNAALGMNAGGLNGIQGPSATATGVHIDRLPTP
jgi:hypothetical protein